MQLVSFCGIAKPGSITGVSQVYHWWKILQRNKRAWYSFSYSRTAKHNGPWNRWVLSPNQFNITVGIPKSSPVRCVIRHSREADINNFRTSGLRALFHVRLVHGIKVYDGLYLLNLWSNWNNWKMPFYLFIYLWSNWNNWKMPFYLLN